MTHTPMRGCEWSGKRPVLDGHPIGVRGRRWDMVRGNEVAAFIAGCVTGVAFVWVLLRLTVTVTPQDFRDLCDSLYSYAEPASDVLAIHREHPYCRIPEVTP